MDGLINLFKPLGITSARGVDLVRRVTNERHSGHAGTLDPLASGVVIICLGKGTKLVERLMDLSKTYRATIRLDVTTDSFDLECPLQSVPLDQPPSRDAVHRALQSFVGEIQQVPPTTSAVKVRGQPAYRRRARGQVVELKPRAIRIYSIDLLAYDWPNAEIRMTCGRGTYVRALARDLGAQLGVGGCLASLVREAVGPFHADQAWTPERLKTATPAEYLIGVEDARRMIEHATVGCATPHADTRS